MELVPIATINGCFPEKFGVPRQAGMAPTAKATIQLLDDFNHEDYLRGIEAHSHLWLIFGFHQNRWNGEGLVRPQRLGGNKKMGVFATRSSFRPNGLGLSAVKLDRVDYKKGTLFISGHDLVDGTPIYDIKPYIPFVDSIREAVSDFAPAPPKTLPVFFSEKADMQLKEYNDEHFKRLIIEVLMQNPTPPFHTDQDRVYGLMLYDKNIVFKRSDEDLMVIKIETFE